MMEVGKLNTTRLAGLACFYCITQFWLVQQIGIFPPVPTSKILLMVFFASFNCKICVKAYQELKEYSIEVTHSVLIQTLSGIPSARGYITSSFLLASFMYVTGCISFILAATMEIVQYKVNVHFWGYHGSSRSVGYAIDFRQR